MKNNKKKTIILSIFVLLVIGLLSGALALRQISAAKTEKELRAKNSKANITEIFHDQANEYMLPLEPTDKDDITIRLRTEKYNVTKAQIQYTSNKGETWNNVEMSFEKHDDTGYFDVWVGKIPAQSELFYYRFICANETGTYYVNRDLVPNVVEKNEYDNGWAVLPGFRTAEWAKGALWYNLSPDAFYNGDISGDTTTSDQNDVNSWNNIRRHLSDKYGGDLKGIADKTEHISSLYADAVFMNPFGKAYQNAGYGPIQYDQVEPTLGNAQSLADMIKVLHDADIKVGSDAVLTFTPQNSVYFDESGVWPHDGASENENSEYTEMYTIYDWPNNYHLSWGGPALDHNSEKLKDLLYANSDSYMQYYTAAPYSLDSWRFDCGGWLYGRTDGDYIKQTEILGEIKENLQKINPDVFLVSEWADKGGMLSNTWDSQWNISLMGTLRSYSQGLADEATLSAGLDSTLDCYPRAIALGIYNCVVNHDEPRLDDENVPAYIEKAGTLTLMTYIGSPSIYYGEEINLDREKEDGFGASSSFYAMEWDESNWDYERYNLYRSLGELRSKYSALKTGAVRELLIDSAQNIYSFGRWDDKGAVITVASQNNSVVTVDVKARLLDIKDGTIVTDWLTGKQYKVDEEGMLHLEVIPGGSVFVTGKKASQYRNQFLITELANAEGAISLTDTNAYFVEGQGKLGKSDSLVMASSKLYGAGYLSGVVDTDGEVVLTVRQDDSQQAVSYNVTVSDGKLLVTARNKKGGNLKTVCESKFTNGNAVRIHRDGNNQFIVQIAEVNKDGKVSDKWTDVKKSSTKLSMEYQTIAGFAPLKGETELFNVGIEFDKDEINFADFNAKTYTAMLEYSDIENVSLKDGRMILTSKQGMTWATTQSKDDDWTFKTKLDSGIQDEGTYAGVVCMSDEMQWVAVGRTVINGESVIFIGSTSDGTVLVDAYAKDLKPQEPVVLQLQRVGGTYTLAYSYDEETFLVLDAKEFANFSSEHVGVYVAGNAEAKFDYVSFGDSIHDGKSINIPYSEGMINVDYSDTVEAVLLESSVIVSGTWEYGKEGYYQTEKEGINQLGFAKKAFENFKLNVTLKLEDGEGYAAIGFGKSEHDSVENNGFLLKYTKDDELIMYKNGVKMAKAVVKNKDDNGTLRVILEVKNSDIKVYIGQNATKIMDFQDTGYGKGYIGFYAVDTAARFMNSRITSLSATWNILTSDNNRKNMVLGGSNSIMCTATTASSLDVYGSVTLMGTGVTDLVTSLTMTVGSTANSESGLLVAASEGKSKAVSGINVALLQGGTLVMRADGEEVANYSLGEDVKTATIMFVKKDRMCQVYLKGVAEPVMTYEDTYERGGTYQLYAVKSTSSFTEIGVEDIHNIAVEESSLYQLWKQGKMFSLDVETYRENYNNYSGWESLKTYFNDHGTWTIEDGVLSCISSPNWASGVTIHDRLFDDFEMEFKYRFDETSANFAGILLYKTKLNETNEEAKYSLLLYSNGEIALYNATNKKTVARATIPNFKVGSFYQLKVVSSGNSFNVYYNNKSLITHTSEELDTAKGFLSFTSNKSYISFDDVFIEPLK